MLSSLRSFKDINYGDIIKKIKSPWIETPLNKDELTTSLSLCKDIKYRSNFNHNYKLYQNIQLLLNNNTFWDYFDGLETIHIEDYSLVYKSQCNGNSIFLKSNMDEYSDYVNYHEIIIGFVLNKLRLYVPNFVFYYGVSNGYLDDNNILFDKDGTNVFSIVESIDEKYDLSEFINICDRKTLIIILLQIFNALSVAYNKYKFIHYDLHDDNILIQQFDNDIDINIYINGQVKTIKTNVLVTIIDYGHSSIEYENVKYKRSELMTVHDCPCPISDPYKLLFFLGCSIYNNEKKEELFDIVESLFKIFDEKLSLEKKIANYLADENPTKSIDYDSKLKDDKTEKKNGIYLSSVYTHEHMLEFIINSFKEESKEIFKINNIEPNMKFIKYNVNLLYYQVKCNLLDKKIALDIIKTLTDNTELSSYKKIQKLKKIQ